jgi:asparagine synthase (glutamine-hydrolysing)
MGAGLAPAGLVEVGLALRARAGGRSPWLNEDWLARHGDEVSDAIRGRGRQRLRDALALTFSTTSLPALLRYEDRNSMAHSIESRVPFLTPALVEFAFRLPENFHVGPDGTSKWLFRHAMRGLVPDAILDRRDKIGFQTPELAWLASLRDWVDGLLDHPVLASIPVLNAAAMRTELDAVLGGRARFDWRIWRWLNLIRWTEIFAVRYE